MSTNTYKSLDFSKLKFAQNFVTTKEGLCDVIPIDWNKNETVDNSKISILQD